MPDSKDRGIMKLGTRTGVDLNAAVASEMTIWQCPLNKSGVPLNLYYVILLAMLHLQ